MSAMIYNIPLQHLPATHAQRLIVRSADIPALINALALENPQRIVSVQITSLQANTEPLNAWGAGLPLELLLTDPSNEFPHLYNHVNLTDQHPVWVLIPVQPGFSKAVKVALALNFALRLELGQPDAQCVAELLEVVDFYLHQPNIAQPIDFVQGLLLGFYHERPHSLWEIFDEAPHTLRYVTEEGRISLAGRLADVEINLPENADLSVSIDQVLAVAAECQDCAFRQSCGGYFKWPRPDYSCSAIKQVFGVLQAAANELRRDMQDAPQ